MFFGATQAKKLHIREALKLHPSEIKLGEVVGLPKNEQCLTAGGSTPPGLLLLRGGVSPPPVMYVLYVCMMYVCVKHHLSELYLDSEVCTIVHLQNMFCPKDSSTGELSERANVGHR